MYNPLISDPKDIKDADLDNKILDLNKKYLIAVRSGNVSLCEQILTIIEQYREEQKKRFAEKNKQINLKDQNINLDSLININ
jgi:hypothetical protein